MDTQGFQVNQIVKGKFAGTFVILRFRDDVGDEVHAQLKSVNPDNHSQLAPGELALPLSVLVPLS